MFFEKNYHNQQQEELRPVNQIANIHQWHAFEFFFIPEFIIYKIPFFNPTYSKDVYQVNFSLSQIISHASCQFFCGDTMHISDYVMQYNVNAQRDSQCSGTIPLISRRGNSDDRWTYHNERRIFLNQDKSDKRERNYPFEQYKFLYPENCLNGENEINKIYYSFAFTRHEYIWRVYNGNNTGSVTFFVPKKKELTFNKGLDQRSNFFTSNVVEGTSFRNSEIDKDIVISEPVAFLQERLVFLEDIFFEQNMLWKGINFYRELIFNREVSWWKTKNFIKSYFLETSFDKHERETKITSQTKLFDFSSFPSLITFSSRKVYEGDDIGEVIVDNYHISPLIKTFYHYSFADKKNKIFQEKNWKMQEYGIKFPLWEDFNFTFKLDFVFKTFFNYKIFLVVDFQGRKIIGEKKEVNKKKYSIGKTKDSDKNFFVFSENKYVFEKDDAIYYYQHNYSFLQEDFSHFQDKFRKGFSRAEYEIV